MSKPHGQVKHYQLPLTESAMATNPRHRIMPTIPEGELCGAPEVADPNLVAEAASYARNCCEDHWQLSALNGHIHMHHDTCFKYVEDGHRRKPQHCRFSFAHFVRFWVKKKDDDADPKSKTIARVGKDPILPQVLGRRKHSTQRQNGSKAFQALGTCGSR